MKTEIFLSGRMVQHYCAEILHRSIPQVPVKNLDGAEGDFILLRCADPVEYWCIFDGQQERVLQMARKYQMRTLTCGFSPYDTLVLSSAEGGRAVVSLQREVHTVFKEVIEPGDYLVWYHEDVPIEEILLLCAGVLLVLGWQGTEFSF